MPARIAPSVVPTRAQGSARTATPADRFREAANGKPWFVSAEMQRQLGGLRRGENGAVAKRPPILEVTVKRGTKAEAERVLARLGIETARVVEERPVRHGWRR
jgi:hypothetical protein